MITKQNEAGTFVGFSMNVNEKLPHTNNLYPVYIAIFLTKVTFHVCTYKYFGFNCIFMQGHPTRM